MSPRCETLPNGLRVVLVPCEAESVAVGFFVASGSRHETMKTSGISHFIEHMLFKGTPTRRQIDITRAIEGHGGNFNASTGKEETMYFAHLPSEHLEEVVDILSDMYLHASINADDFKREKMVILEEIKMYDDEPDSVAMTNLHRALFPGDMLGEDIGGSAKSLMPMKPADLKRHIASHYRADNTVIAIAGDFDEEKALECVRRSMRGLKKSKAKPFRPAKFKLPPLGEIKVAREVKQTQLALGFRTFGIEDDRRYAAVVLDAILGRGMSSRLFQEVREKRGLSYDISSSSNFCKGVGAFTITAGLDPKNARKALATIDRELKRIRETKVSAAELKRTKDFIIGNFRLSHELVRSKMFYYGHSLLEFGRIESPQSRLDRIRGVSAADIQAVANAIFRPANRSVSWVVPKS